LQELGIGAAVLALTVAVGLAIARSVLGQLGGEPTVAIAAMQDIARGDLSQRLSSAPSHSLMGQTQAMVDSRCAPRSARCAQPSTPSPPLPAKSPQGNQDLSSRTRAGRRPTCSKRPAPWSS
jgi:methyl-accepting chemotaxis protein